MLDSKSYKWNNLIPLELGNTVSEFGSLVSLKKTSIQVTKEVKEHFNKKNHYLYICTSAFHLWWQLCQEPRKETAGTTGTNQPPSLQLLHWNLNNCILRKPKSFLYDTTYN